MAKNTTDSTDAPPSGKRKLIILILIIVLLLAIGGGVAAYFLLFKSPDAEAEGEGVASEDTSESQDSAPATPEPVAAAPSPGVAPGATLTYQELKPLTISLASSGPVHIMRIGITVATYDPEVAKAIDRHEPMIRSDLLSQLALQEYDSLITPEGKDALREELRTTLSTLLVKAGEHSLIEEVLFTDIVMQ